MKNRIISLLLAVALVLVLLPAVQQPVMASDYETPSGYNDHDYQALVAFLEHKTSDGKTNGRLLFGSSYTPADPKTWKNYPQRIVWDTRSPVSVTEIHFFDKAIEGTLNVQGFSALESLFAENTKITSINASNCKALTEVTCNGWRYYGRSVLEELRLDGCPALKTINCEVNPLTRLSLEEDNALTDINCKTCELNALPLSDSMEDLSCVDCSSNQITSLQLTGLTGLKTLSCGENQLKTLDLTPAAGLEELHCERNEIQSLDLTANTALKELDCNDNQLTELRLNNGALKNLICSNNQLNALDLTACTKLIELDCKNNQLTALSLLKQKKLTKLDCGENLLSALNLSENTKLKEVSCRSNRLTGSGLTLPAATERSLTLDCGKNKLTSLSIPKDLEIYELVCDNNQLSKITVPQAESLGVLDCKYNPLGSIDLSAYTDLDRLDCDACQLTALDVTANTDLDYLSCYNNPISSLDLSKNTGLEELYCSKTKITALDLAGNKNLVFLGCRNNSLKRLDLSNQADIPIDLVKANANGHIGFSQLGYMEWVDDEVSDDGDWMGDWEAVVDTVTAYAVPDEGYQVLGWYDETGTKLSASAAYQLPESLTAKELTAKFKAVVGIPEVSAANVASTGKIKLTWKAVPNAANYEIWRASSKRGTYKLLKTTESLSFTNTSPKAGETWYYKLRALKADGKAGPFCEPVTRTCDLPRPVVTGGHNADTGKNKLTWEAVEGAVKYEVYRSASKTSSYSLMKTTTDLSYVNTTAKAGETWYYKVMAVHSKSAANSACSEIKTITCDLPRPVVTIALSSGKPKLTWKAIDGAKEYKIYRSETKSSGYSLMMTTTNLSYTNTKAEKGKTYYYKVMAIHEKSAANSAYSLVKSIKATK